ncbi:dr1-associated corepressor homolog [Melanaphis sacchari]|uniref:dr1-associated corepressor homolog n=1 Tax=Melanaphis sacchari TaxID=742174 RepID=UPI000DC130B8|nr:dr1-associated corepressor homolog [Melanaphis sacchari]
MKNMIFYSISLSLVGLMCCHNEANENIPLNILEPDEIKNMLNFAVNDDFNLEIFPLSNYFKMMCSGSWNKVIDTINKMFDNLLVDNTINKSVKNTTNRITRNANTANDPLTQSNISKVQQNLNMSTVSVFQNKVTENQTQPHIDYSITNSTPSADFLSAAFISTGPFINNNTNRNNNTSENKMSNTFNNLFTWSGFKEYMDRMFIIVLTALLFLFIGILTYTVERSCNVRREINQQQEIFL